MKLSQMTGTPWHIETLKMSETDNRRRKQWCKYYENDFCKELGTKCYNCKNCKYYVFDESKKKEITVKKDKNYHLENYYDKKYIVGSFLLQYSDGTKEMFKIDKNIKKDAPIIDYVFKCAEKGSFIFNGEKIIVLQKHLKYSYEAKKIQDPFLKLILSPESLDEECENNTEFIHFAFKIKLIDENKKYGLFAGKSIRWDDPLLKKVIDMKPGTIFEYKNKKILLQKTMPYRKVDSKWYKEMMEKQKEELEP